MLIATSSSDLIRNEPSNLCNSSSLKNVLDASVNFKAHNISYNFWNNKSLSIAQKKLFTQLHSGELMQKDWISPTKCLYCNTSQSFKHCFLECSSIDQNILLGLTKVTNILLNTHTSHNPIELAWEDKPSFNQGWYVSTRGIVSIKLGNFIVDNKLEENNCNYFLSTLFLYLNLLKCRFILILG